MKMVAANGVSLCFFYFLSAVVSSLSTSFFFRALVGVLARRWCCGWSAGFRGRVWKGFIGCGLRIRRTEMGLGWFGCRFRV